MIPIVLALSLQLLDDVAAGLLLLLVNLQVLLQLIDLGVVLVHETLILLDLHLTEVEFSSDGFDFLGALLLLGVSIFELLVGLSQVLLELFDLVASLLQFFVLVLFRLLQGVQLCFQLF